MAFQLSSLEPPRGARLCHNDAACAALIAAALFLIAGPAAQAQTGYLTYPTGISPTGVTAADLNGDGLPDLVIANSGNALTLLLNNASGGFTPLPPVTIPTSPANLAPQMTVAADLNGDGKTDLVVLVFGGLVVLLGNGDGTFQPPLALPIVNAYTFQAADLNGDGIPDLAVTIPAGGGFIPVGATLVTLVGNGDGTFRDGPFYSLGFTPWAALTIGDFNHDSAPDIAVVSESAVTTFLNDGKGNFTAVVSSGEPWDFAPGIVAADFNGDGLLDLAVTYQTVDGQAGGTTAILLGRGDGTFQSASSLTTDSFFSQIVAMDLNGDGHIDLAEGIPVNTNGTGPVGLVFFAGRGDGTFENGYAFSGSGDSGYFAIADFTGSGAMGFAGANGFPMANGLPTGGDIVILPRAVWPSLTLANVSSAGLVLGPLAAGSLATAFGSGLATQTAEAAGPPQPSLGGDTVSVTDSAGAVRSALLLYVSSGQVNYLIPPGTATGPATVSIAAGGAVTATGQIDVVPVAPSLFTLNAANLAAAYVVLVSQNGDQTYEPIYQTDQSGNVTALPIDVAPANGTAYLVLYGTGIRNLTGPGSIRATVASLNAPVTYAGPQGLNNAEGLDQVNIQLPSALAAATPFGTTLRLTVDGQPSNPVTLLIQ